MRSSLEHQTSLTRRQFFGRGATGIGAAALGSLLGASTATNPHFAPKAKRVIYLFQHGGPSQLDLFDHKPALRKLHGTELPGSVRGMQRLTGMTSGQKTLPVTSSLFEFQQHGRSGAWVSELMPHTAKVADELCFIRSMHTEAINHDPAVTFLQTGHQQPGRPSLGAWTSYGLGSDNRDLPAFVVLITQGFGNMQALAARFWGSAFLPSEHQGCKLRSSGDPVLFLRDPPGVRREDRRAMLDLAAAFARTEARRSLDPEVEARLVQQEMAFRMQSSVPELVDVAREGESTWRLYGDEARQPGTFAASCLLARRLVERGVRFVQLYMRGWDQHSNLPAEMRAQCKAVDRPIAALLTDLRARGLLDDTLVVWGGEFGRTVYSQGGLARDNYGRDHHPRCFTMWLAGGGVRPGHVHGETCDHGYNIVRDPVSVHDLHATMLHLLGFDHERLVYRHQGRDFRLTDVHGRVVRELLA
jgi:hypothetical protein